MGLRARRNVDVEGAAAHAPAVADERDFLPIPLIDVDFDGIVTSFNAAATELLGWRREQVVGRRSGDVLGRDLTGNALPSSRRRVRINHASGLVVEADVVVQSVHDWERGVGRSVIAMIPEPSTADRSSGGAPVELWTTAARGVQQLGGRAQCLVVGIVGLQAINRGYSRSTGDAVVAEVRRRLMVLSAESGYVARIGGNQFLCAVPIEVADRLNLTRVLAGLTQPIETPLGEVRVGAVIGSALGETRSAMVLIDQADFAMQRALLRGVGSIEEGTGLSRMENGEHPRLQSSLIDAVAQGRIGAVFQPVIEMATGEIVQLEALARWHSDELGDVDPSAFIEAAENIGLIHDLGLIVMNAALDAVVGEQAGGGWGDRRMSVNLSARQIAHPDVVARILGALAERGLDPSVLQIEVTDGRALANATAAVAHLSCLRELGVSIALDDFGAGSANFSYLRDLPVDVVKIDRRFIDGMQSHFADREIIRTILILARNVGVMVIAEGVEGRDQHDELTRIGCRYAQGYLYARPRGRDALLAPVEPGGTRGSDPEPGDELLRADAFDRVRLLDPSPDVDFDDIAREAASACATPVAFVSLLGDERQWFKARIGIEVDDVPCGQTPCTYTVRGRDIMLLNDTEAEPHDIGLRAAGDGAPLRFYAGIPLRSGDGYNLGTLCVADVVPRDLDQMQRDSLRRLARHAALLLDRGLAQQQLAVARGQLEVAREHLEELRELRFHGDPATERAGHSAG